MMLKKIWLLVLVMALLSGGCAFMKNMPSRCDTIPAGESVLCDAADSLGVSLGSISIGVRIANSVALGTEVYTPAEALSVITALENVLNQGVTYNGFKTELLSQAISYPGMVEISGVILDNFNTPNLMKSADAKILLDWLHYRRLELEK